MLDLLIISEMFGRLRFKQHIWASKWRSKKKWKQIHEWSQQRHRSFGPQIKKLMSLIDEAKNQDRIKYERRLRDELFSALH